MTLRALFVDDEPLVLSGLRRMLRSLRHDWEMSFASSGKEALALLGQQDFAVIVSDMRMPEMDGAALLSEVAIRHPDVARLVLSGHAELEAILRAIRPAHQFVAKPCDPGSLERALERIRAVRLHDRQGAICRKLGAHRRLPSPAARIDQLRSVLAKTPADLDQAGEIVSGDIAMTMQVLRLVNSACFGPPTSTFDPRRAVSVLGGDIMNGLLNEVELFRPVNDQDETAVLEVNERARALAGRAPALAPGAGHEIDPDVRAMMILAGPLAAVEIQEKLDGKDELALSALLLAYWGLEVEINAASAAAVACAPPSSPADRRVEALEA